LTKNKRFLVNREPFIAYIPLMKLLKNLPFIFILVILVTCYDSCKTTENGTPAGTLQLASVKIGSKALDLNNPDTNSDMPADLPITVSFTSPLDTASIRTGVTLLKNNIQVPVHFSYPTDHQRFIITPDEPLENLQSFVISISNQIKGKNQETFPGLEIGFKTVAASLSVTSLKIGNQVIAGTGRIAGVPKKSPIEVKFNHPLDPLTVTSQSVYVVGDKNIPLDYLLSDSNRQLTLTPIQPMSNLVNYFLNLTSQIKGSSGEIFQFYSQNFYTTYDSVPVMPVISDEELLTLVQRQTFKYFWDFGHPVSGLARERNSSGDVVTSGGSGFGLMAIIVGIDRGFITRAEGVGRLNTIVDFLGTANRFHGAWSHWLNGNTGVVVPFGQQDDGGDLVETSYMAQGLLTVRQYLNASDAGENSLIGKINDLWNSIEWNWYTRDGQKVLYWHWSPNFGWAMNMPIRGYNEALITYIMSASSVNYGITADVYHQGWTNSSNFVNGHTYYGYTLPLGFDYGGPLFFAHYSFLGVNPNGLSDQYADYWVQNLNHTLINREYCITNPRNYIGYGAQCWGLTASDNQSGYSAHSPTNDLGVITPTAAISSIPYTPEYSMNAIKFFYYTLGDRLWGDYGFYDAFNLTEGWTADSYLAIDEGPIVVMIENYRTGLLWNLFMSSPEVQAGLDKLGFQHK
jgi:hypothetical protein